MLGWSINLCKVFGIQLAVHASFVLLLAYWGYQGWLEGGVVGMGWSVGLILLFFVCVILHELGHSLTAPRRKIGHDDVRSQMQFRFIDKNPATRAAVAELIRADREGT